MDKVCFVLKILIPYSINLFVFRWVFETGRLAPGYDLFRCVVNIPEDVQRVGEELAEDGEQLHVMAGGISKFLHLFYNLSYTFICFRCNGKNVRSSNDGWKR